MQAFFLPSISHHRIDHLDIVNILKGCPPVTEPAPPNLIGVPISALYIELTTGAKHPIYMARINGSDLTSTRNL